MALRRTSLDRSPRTVSVAVALVPHICFDPLDPGRGWVAPSVQSPRSLSETSPYRESRSPVSAFPLLLACPLAWRIAGRASLATEAKAGVRATRHPLGTALPISATILRRPSKRAHSPDRHQPP